ARTIGVDLDPQTIWVVEIERVAHQVVGGAGPLPHLREMPHEAAERCAIGQQYRKMVEAESAATRYRRGPLPLPELDQHDGLVERPQKGATRTSFEHPQTDHPPVVLGGAVQISDLE